MYARSTFFCLLLILLAGCGGKSDPGSRSSASGVGLDTKNTPADDKAALQGTWEVAEYSFETFSIVNAVYPPSILTNDTLTITQKSNLNIGATGKTIGVTKSITFRFVLDSGKSPKQFDAEVKEVVKYDANGKEPEKDRVSEWKASGIYTLEGDTLKILLVKAGEPRPKTFPVATDLASAMREFRGKTQIILRKQKP